MRLTRGTFSYLRVRSAPLALTQLILLYHLLQLKPLAWERQLLKATQA